MKRVFIVTLVTLTVMLFSSCCNSSDEILGTWIASGAVIEGELLPSPVQFDIADCTAKISVGSNSQTWNYRLNAMENPKEIDFIPTEGPFAGQTLKGIFKISNDVLYLCYTRQDTTGPRPRDFLAKEKGVVLYMLRRKT